MLDDGVFAIESTDTVSNIVRTWSLSIDIINTNFKKTTRALTL